VSSKEYSITAIEKAKEMFPDVDPIVALDLYQQHLYRKIMETPVQNSNFDVVDPAMRFMYDAAKNTYRNLREASEKERNYVLKEVEHA